MKRIITVFLLMISLLCLCACGSIPQSSSPASSPAAPATSENTVTSATSEPVISEPEPAAEETSYETIYDEYAQKLRETTPVLIDEYLAEAAENTNGLEGLAALCNQKIEKLAVISNDGVQKMAQYMMFHGSGNTDEYMDWSQKLYDVYMEEAQKITDVYMSSAMG